MRAIRELLDRRMLAEGLIQDQWHLHQRLLGPSAYRGTRLCIWEVPEPGWYMWGRVLVPKYRSPWLEIPVKDATPQVAALAIKAYWEALGIGLWRDLLTMTAEFLPEDKRHVLDYQSPPSRKKR